MNASDSPESIIIAIVGPCAAGKSTLVEALRAAGYNAHEVAQEHSYVPDMWQKITRPDLLIYLDVSEPVAKTRRPENVYPRWRKDLNQRLHHAREHADLYVNTDNLSPQEILNTILQYLKDVAGLRP